MARRHSHVRDLAVMAWEARGGDGDLYLGWHETTEGFGWLGDSGSRRRPEFLNERALEVWR
jgi:hypothetical protein